MISIIHHGGTIGVTGSWHELVYSAQASALIDCGLFQGDDYSAHGLDSANADKLEIDFDLSQVKALCLTHAHIDHIGRIPYLLLAGFESPIYCSQATAKILPIMLADAVRLGITQNRRLIDALMERIAALIVPVAYKAWQRIDSELKVKFQPAGHVLGSAYLEFQLAQPQDCAEVEQPIQRIVFSGDLGAPYSPILSNPRSPYKCDLLVLESTYGDRLHAGRKQRRQQLQSIVERCLRNSGTILIPAFSLGRTQALLYEFEQIIHKQGGHWQDIEIIVDSPMANSFTSVYRELQALWDKEARRKLKAGRSPLDFEQLYTIDEHQTHQQVVEYLRKTGRPSIVIAASGMCTGGRIVAYLKALIEDPRTDIVFVGYQSRGSNGHKIQKYGDKSRYPNGYVELDNQRYVINAGVHSISGYSAHADQKDLINFVKRMRYRPKQIRLVHGDARAKLTLARELEGQLGIDTKIV